MDDDKSAAPEPRGWQCGDQPLRAGLALTLADRLTLRDFAALEWLDGTIHEAGPDFCRAMLDRLTHEELPF